MELNDVLALMVSTLAAVISFGAFCTSDERSKEANRTARGANDIAREARDIAREANSIYRDTNVIAFEANEKYDETNLIAAEAKAISSQALERVQFRELREATWDVREAARRFRTEASSEYINIDGRTPDPSEKFKEFRFRFARAVFMLEHAAAFRHNTAWIGLMGQAYTAVMVIQSYYYYMDLENGDMHEEIESLLDRIYLELNTSLSNLSEVRPTERKSDKELTRQWQKNLSDIYVHDLFNNKFKPIIEG